MIDAQTAELIARAGGWVIGLSGVAIIVSGIALGASGALTRGGGGYGPPRRPALAGYAFLALLGSAACTLIGVATAIFGILAG